MGEIWPRIKSYPPPRPPLIKQKLKSTLPPPHIIIILRLTTPQTPLKKSPPIDSIIPSLIVGFLPPVQTSETLDSCVLCRLRMNWEILHLLQHLWH